MGRKRYKCPECGNIMAYETEDSLVCENCGYGVDVEMYGLTEDEYQSLYPTKEDYLMSIGEYYGEDEDNDDDGGESYDPEIDGMTNFDDL